jgi:hypothetical protein
MAVTAAAKADIVQSILAPIDCYGPPGEGGLPSWASTLAFGASSFPGPQQLPAAVVFFLDTLLSARKQGCGTSLSKPRLAALLAAGDQQIYEAIPAIVAILGGRFTLGLDAEKRKTVVYQLTPPEEQNATVRGVAYRVLAHLVATAPPDLFPEVTARAAADVLQQGLKDRDAAARRAAEQAFPSVSKRVLALYGVAEGQKPKAESKRGLFLTGLGIVGLIGVFVAFRAGRRAPTA